MHCERRLGHGQAVQLPDPVQGLQPSHQAGQVRSTASRSADPGRSCSASSSSDFVSGSEGRGQLDSVPEAARGGQAQRIRVCDAVIVRCPVSSRPTLDYVRSRGG